MKRSARPSPLTRIRLVWNTVRWLRPVQVYGRLWFRLRRPRPDTRAAPPRRPLAPGWRSRPREPSLQGPGTLSLLGETRRIAARADWNRTDVPKLWLYNAHYFDDLVASDPAPRRQWQQDLVRRWIDENPPGTGNGWEPYPTSLRIVNWVKWSLADPSSFDAAAEHSLAVQARWLAGRLEHHLLGNHLWANAKALVFAGVFFEGDEPDTWRQRGMALIARELDEQLLADGAHFERSPMYHAIVAEDVLDLLQLAAKEPSLFPERTVAAWREAAVRMLEWSHALSHPDGEIALFNDAAFGVAATPAMLDDAAAAIGIAVRHPQGGGRPAAALLRPSGFARLSAGDAVLFADVGGVGPSYLPGHAHAGTLSFELSVHGRRALVNGGTSTYEEGEERTRQRGTGAHNTVRVGGEDSSEVWASFRVARRARAFASEAGADAGQAWLQATHDGYLRLPARVLHTRRWQLTSNALEVVDTLEGRPVEAEARFHFAPGCRLAWEVAGGEARVETTTWHPRFGESRPIDVLVVRLLAPRCRTTFRWD